ncbi:hypothetical protein FOVG_18707 [Fusarium oxysporum f. sp. pisi HDV247]|uniref:Uncharacterized protein n=1 Tax=Fusarium oxysporum f. sp. pisi HDV247 TaxID=1080344 RepID=W9NPV4_FUSOX|nr:hypothetical protein FOVG_18707 [Fusarium oxysporum f. sp. pisi HDV247]
MASAPSLAKDSATVRRRLLQANHTRNYRNRQKAIKDTTTANHQGELSSDAIALVAENELLELDNSSLPDTGGVEDNGPGPDTKEIEEDGIFACDTFTISNQEVDDPTISTIEPGP